MATYNSSNRLDGVFGLAKFGKESYISTFTKTILIFCMPVMLGWIELQSGHSTANQVRVFHPLTYPCRRGTRITSARIGCTFTKCFKRTSTRIGTILLSNFFTYGTSSSDSLVLVLQSCKT